MKACRYCGRESDDTAAHCAGCGTAFPPLELGAPEPIGSETCLSAWRAGALAVAIVYAPYLCLFALNGHSLAWMKLWPILPGVVVGFLLEALVWPKLWPFINLLLGGGLPRYAPRSRDVLPVWGQIAAAALITLFHLAVVWLVLSRFPRRRVPLAIGAGVYSMSLGVLGYLLFAA